MKRTINLRVRILRCFTFRYMARGSAYLLPVVTMAAPCVGQDMSVQEPSSASSNEAFLGVRVLKTGGAGNVGWSATLPASCAGCRLVINRYTSGQTDKDIFFHLFVPRSLTKIGPIHLRIEPSAVRDVLVGNTDYELPLRGFARLEPRADGMTHAPFTRTREGIAFDVPVRPHGVSLPPDDLADVTEQYTFIETPGVYIRIGHADEQRRRGAYATGPWPKVEIAAAINLEFAAREAINALKLDSTLGKYGVANIMLMNFDTNYPTLGPDSAHDDWPPHWHMHLLWNGTPKVRKVGHFYIGPDGLMLQNQSGDLVSLTSSTRANTWYARGQTDETRTPDGRLIYAHTITPEGYFTLTSPDGACRFTPISKAFDSGVNLSCDGRTAPLSVRAEDDTGAGTLRLFLGGRLAKTYRYDPDTGAVLSVSSAER